MSMVTSSITTIFIHDFLIYTVGVDTAVFSTIDGDRSSHIAALKNTSTRACTNTCAAFNSRDCIDHRVVALDRDRSAHVFGTSAADACRISAARGCDIAGVDPNSRCFVGLLSLVAAADACTVGAACCFNGRAVNIDIAARLVVSSADARIIFFSGGDDLARSVNVQGRMLIFLS